MMRFMLRHYTIFSFHFFNFYSLASSQTGHKWNGREASYPAPGKKKYTVIYEALKDTGQSAKLEAAQGGVVKYADPKVFIFRCKKTFAIMFG